MIQFAANLTQQHARRRYYIVASIIFAPMPRQQHATELIAANSNERPTSAQIFSQVKHVCGPILRTAIVRIFLLEAALDLVKLYFLENRKFQTVFPANCALPRARFRDQPA